MRHIIAVIEEGVLCSVDEVEDSVYRKSGVWISLGLHLLLFAFLFFYGNQKMRQQERFVELAEFSFEQPIKSVDTTLPLKRGVHQKTTSNAVDSAKSAPVKSSDTPVANQPPVADVPETAPVASSTGLTAKAGDVISENAGWDSAKGSGSLAAASEQSPVQSSIQSSVKETKKMVISTHSSEGGASNALAGWGAYGHQLSVESARFKKYPMAALSSRIQGTVLVSVKVGVSGSVVVGIKRSSGYDLLDEQAVSTVTRATKNVALPAELQNSAKELFIPIQFYFQN